MTKSDGDPAPKLVVIRDIAISWSTYLDAASALEPLPQHLLLHLAGPTPEGVRIVELWDSRTGGDAATRDSLAQLDRGAATRPGAVRTLDVSHTLGPATRLPGAAEREVQP